MTTRLDYAKAAPGALKTLVDMEIYLAKCGLERSLVYLVKMRASQINGCTYCLDMHSKDARAEGETEQRLYALNAWRETPFYSARERAALAWTESLTRIAEPMRRMTCIARFASSLPNEPSPILLSRSSSSMLGTGSQSASEQTLADTGRLGNSMRSAVQINETSRRIALNDSRHLRLDYPM